MRFMRSTDNRGRDLKDWAKRSQHAQWMREKREQDEIHDVNMDHAERFVKALEKDVSTRRKAFIPRGIPKAA